MRIKRGVNANKKRVKIRKLSKGYRGSKSTLYRVARQAVMKSGNYAYVGRKNKKRDMRNRWIARINAAARELWAFIQQNDAWNETCRNRT